MELQDFIQNIVNLFDDIDTSNFSALTDFKDNDEWNSLLALSVIAMVDEEYGVIITSDEIKQAKTIEELYMILKSK
ncbi:acyl carrier protein [Bacteroides oleiciplenus]|uniref:Carrier domain-containing protein n=1 Tax=Bacteroides oleiciplenus YIT 12058 TaxID=742727 RepID=K9E3T2_9BACE|nr:phosphopantetheine-binding protein [Bacteroides oleiciplenus]EKU91323.1 hypothetical protein HMPREF9447_01513 [Bacteroides oleiciplenus YIT 12058]